MGGFAHSYIVIGLRAGDIHFDITMVELSYRLKSIGVEFPPKFETSITSGNKIIFRVC